MRYHTTILLALLGADRLQTGQSSLIRHPNVAPESKELAPVFLASSSESAGVNPLCVVQNDTGSQAPNMKVTTAETNSDGCRKACRATKDCTHYTFNVSSKKCHLKRGTPKYYSYKGDISGTPSCDTSCFVKGVSYSKAPHIANSMVTSLATDCQEACAANPKCKAFVWREDESKCYLEGGDFAKYKESGKFPQAIAGPKDYCDQGGYLLEVEAENGGAPLQPSAGPPITMLPNGANDNPKTSCIRAGDTGSEAENMKLPTKEQNETVCMELCQKTPKCTHFTYNVSSKLCHIKEGRPQFYTYKGDVTGSRSCDISCFVKGVTYSNAPNVAESLSTPMVTDCQAACMANPKCKVFVWHEDKSKCDFKGEGFAKHKESGKFPQAIAGPKDFCDLGGNLLELEAANGGAPLKPSTGPASSTDGVDFVDQAIVKVVAKKAPAKVEVKLDECYTATFDRTEKTVIISDGTTQHSGDMPGTPLATGGFVALFYHDGERLSIVYDFEMKDGSWGNTTVETPFTTCSLRTVKIVGVPNSEGFEGARAFVTEDLNKLIFG